LKCHLRLPRRYARSSISANTSIAPQETYPEKDIDVKEVKIRPQVGEHDLQLKIRNINRFIEEGDKAKVVMYSGAARLSVLNSHEGFR